MKREAPRLGRARPADVGAGPGAGRGAAALPARVGARLVVREAFADLLAAPRHQAELVSQGVLGEVLCVRRAREGWVLAEAANGYSGWVRAWALAVAPRARAAGQRIVRVVVPYLPILATPSRRAERLAEAGFLSRLPLLGASGAFFRVALPGRGSGAAWLPRAGAERWEPRRADSAAPALRLLAVGERLLGTPYLWGGTTSRGYDCSGFSLRMYEWAGIALPRDAREQAALGIDFDDPRLARPGDLLFFGTRGRPVSHVAIAAGTGRILHAGPPCVRLDQLAPPASRAAHRDDLLRIFRGGRRYPSRSGDPG